MRILLINPNVTEEITKVMTAEALMSASAGTVIVPFTATYGTTYVENRIEASIASQAVLEAVAEHHGDCDAAIVSAFGDPGVFAARELADIPVIGIAEAAFLIAYTLGRRYAMVCLTKRLRTWYMECAADYGLDGRMAAVRALAVPVRDITRAKEDLPADVVEQCLLAVEEDDAEVVILAGGPLAGLAREIAPQIPVPVVDGISSAVRLAEVLVSLGHRPPERGSFARPQSKQSRNLSPALATMIERSGG